MAKDDLHVIIYKLLSYLYRQLKDGAGIDERKIDENAFEIPHSYWVFIMAELHDLGYTAGYKVVPINGGRKRIELLDRARITFAGVEYLTDDSFMKKVKEENV